MRARVSAQQRIQLEILEEGLRDRGREEERGGERENRREEKGS